MRNLYFDMKTGLWMEGEDPAKEGWHCRVCGHDSFDYRSLSTITVYYCEKCTSIFLNPELFGNHETD